MALKLTRKKLFLAMMLHLKFSKIIVNEIENKYMTEKNFKKHFTSVQASKDQISHKNITCRNMMHTTNVCKTTRDHAWEKENTKSES